jgi:NMD protein affecting ribosome stability and mRNA decay
MRIPKYKKGDLVLVKGIRNQWASDSLSYYGIIIEVSSRCDGSVIIYKVLRTDGKRTQKRESHIKLIVPGNGTVS